MLAWERLNALGEGKKDPPRRIAGVFVVLY